MRTTITLNDTLYKTLRLQAAASDTTISSIVQDALVQQLLEDAEDLEDARARAEEPNHPFDQLVAELKAEGLL